MLAGIIVFLWHGLRASLRAFPYGFVQASAQPLGPRPRSLLQVQMELRIPVLSASAFKAIGWPYLALSPKVEFPSVFSRTSFLLGLLVGWWTFCLCVACEGALPPGIIVLLGVMLAGIRLLIYCTNVATLFDIWDGLPRAGWSWRASTAYF